MLQEQSLQLLRILIEHKGEIATRDEIKKRLWPKDAVMDFEQGINDCIEKLRNVFGDSGENPQYIETLARHGYRLMMAVTFELGAAEQNAAGGNEDLALRAEERRASLDQSGGHGLSSGRTDEQSPFLDGQFQTCGTETETMPGSPTGSGQTTFTVGQIISGRFRIVRFIGEGGMGEVYEAEDLEVGDRLALKTIRSGISSDPRWIARFKEEIKLARRITHPNVCRVFDLESQETDSSRILYLTMELLQGETLAVRLDQKGLMSAEESLPLIRQMAEALGAIHDAGVVHRDFKPANVILVGAEGQARCVVTDFGLARPTLLAGAAASEPRRVAIAEGISGTPPYMAPEQITGDDISPATDVYAFGMVMYRMVTGRLPFPKRVDFPELLDQMAEKLLAPSEYCGELSPLWDAAILRCLEYKATARFPNVREVVEALENTPSDLVKNTSRLKAWLLPGNWRSLLTYAVVFAVVVGGLLLWTGRRPPQHPLDLAPLTNDSGLSWDPSLSADGKLLAYSSDRSGPGNLNIWIQNLVNGSSRQLTQDKGDDTTPALSPDGTVVAYRSDHDGGGIYVAPLAGDAERLVAKFGRNPRFSPDGASILYWTGDEHFIGDPFVPDGKVFVVSSQGGEPEPLIPDFADARYPVWSPDGEFILLQASREGGVTFDRASDLWMVSRHGDTAVRTGAFKLLEREELVLFGCPFYWTGDMLVFSARKQGRAGLWQMPLGRDGTARLPLTRLTGGSSDDISPWVSASGRLATASTGNDVNIWRIPVTSGIVTAPSGMVRITSGAGSDQDPSVSADGNTLVFKRRIGRTWTTTVRWTDTGAEASLPAAGGFDAIVSPDGSRVAYSAPSDGISSIFIIPIRGGDPKEVCHNCGNVVDWSSDGDRLLYNAQGQLSMLEVSSGTRVEVMTKSDTAVFDEARISPDGGWLAFTRTSGQNSSRIEVVKLGRAGSQLHPIAVTEGNNRDQHPAWSPDGNSLFMYSNRDGFACVWRVDLQSSTKIPVRPPQPIAHFHYARLSPRHLVLTAWRIAVGGQFLFLNLGEMTGNIFEANLPAR
jgi:serine/threonine protein kinase/DNA-binding winged helix-turn-helix (wHTH) protein